MVWLKDNRIEALNFKIVEVDKHGNYGLVLECENGIKVFVDTALFQKIIKTWEEI
jgi:hypothetical protein